MQKNVNGLHPLPANIAYLFMACGMLLQTPLFSLLLGNEYTMGHHYGFTIVMEVLLIGLPGYILLRHRRQDAKVFSVTPQPWQVLLLLPLVFFGIIITALLSALVSMLVSFMGGVPLTASPPLPDASNTPMIALMLFAVGFVPALCEETAFRGLLYHSYLPYGRLRAVCISAVLFALLHGSPVALPSHLFLGVVLGLLLLWTGSIWMPVIYHMLHNTFAMLVSLFTPRPAGEMTQEEALATIGELSNPMTVLMLAGMLTFVLAVYIGLLALLYGLSKKHSPLAALPPRLSLRPLWLLPLLPALGLVLYQYVQMGLYMFQ